MPAPDRKRRLTAFAVAMAVLIATPLAVVAADAFNDVPNSNVHHDDITWLRDNGVTFGCNPPANTEFCPGEPVLRQQMASFMRRLAENQVVDAATAVTAETAQTATPVGPAGGALDGEYPDPGIASGAVGSDELTDNEPFHIVGETGEPPFEGGWDNFGGDFSRAGFFKDQQDIVHLSGTVTGGTSGQPVFTLPAGYRPSARLIMPAPRGSFTAGSLNLRIDPDGTVRFFCEGGCGAFVNGLDGLSFRAGPGSITPAAGSGPTPSSGEGGSATD